MYDNICGLQPIAEKRGIKVSTVQEEGSHQKCVKNYKNKDNAFNLTSTSLTSPWHMKINQFV